MKHLKSKLSLSLAMLGVLSSASTVHAGAKDFAAHMTEIVGPVTQFADLRSAFERSPVGSRISRDGISSYIAPERLVLHNRRVRTLVDLENGQTELIQMEIPGYDGNSRTAVPRLIDAKMLKDAQTPTLSTHSSGTVKTDDGQSYSADWYKVFSGQNSAGEEFTAMSYLRNTSESLGIEIEASISARDHTLKLVKNNIDAKTGTKFKSMIKIERAQLDSLIGNDSLILKVEAHLNPDDVNLNEISITYATPTDKEGIFEISEKNYDLNTKSSEAQLTESHNYGTRTKRINSSRTSFSGFFVKRTQLNGIQKNALDASGAVDDAREGAANKNAILD